MTREATQRSTTATTDRHRWHTAASYDEATRRIQRRNAALVARTHPAPETVRRALDLGCGTGALTAELLGRLDTTARVTALDVSADMLAEARARVTGPGTERVEFRLGSFLDPAVFEDTAEPYDAVFSNAALHWMYPRYDDCFAQVRRLLAPGGLLCAASAGRSAATEEFDRWVQAATARLVPGGGDDFARRRMTTSDVTALAHRTGLTVEDVFLLERRLTVPCAAYATWWLASGGPWQTDPPPEERAVEMLTDVLGGPGRELEMVHASVFAVLRRP